MSFMLTLTLALLGFMTSVTQAAERKESPPPRYVLEAKKQTILSSLIAGKLSHVYVQEGDRVKKGKWLAVINCMIYKARKEKAEAELDAAKATMTMERDLQEIQQTKLHLFKRAEANVKKALANLDEASNVVKMCIIRAPFGGLVVKRHVHPYQNVVKSQPLLEIIDDSSLRVLFLPPSSWLNWLQIGMPFKIRIDETGNEYQVKISKIIPVIDPVSQTARMFGEIQGNQQGLIPGMSGVIKFPPKKAKK